MKNKYKNINKIRVALLACATLFGILAFSQTPKKVTPDTHIISGGGVADTITADSTVIRTFYANPFATQIALQVKSVKISGANQKINYVLQKSFDNQYFVSLDTLKINVSDSVYNGIFDIKNSYSPYFRIVAATTEDAQKLRFTYFITIKK